MEANDKKETYAETYLGTTGGALPLLVMIAAIAIFSLAGMRSVTYYWCAGFLGIVTGFLVYKDKNRFQKALVGGLTSPTFATTLIILLVASVMGKVFSSSYLGESLLYVLSVLNVPSVVVPLATFIIGALISTASGSSSVVNLALVPVLFPLGVQMGCNSGLMLGAIVSGAVFGDNLAPISDSTIVSALTQGAEVGETVRTRLKYSITAFIPAAVLFLVFGFTTTGTNAGASLSVDSTHVSSLLFLLLPVLLVVLIIKKVNFLVALLIGDVVGIIMLLLFGYTDVATLFSSDGVIVSGIDGIMEAVVFMMFIFMVLQLTQETGFLEKFAEFMHTKAKSERIVESISGLFVCVICVLTTIALPTMVFCGPIVRRIEEPYRISRTRSANVLGGLSNGLSMLLPYGAVVIVVATLANSTGVLDYTLSAVEFVGYNFFCIMLVLVYWVAILTGWGRDYEPDGTGE